MTPEEALEAMLPAMMCAEWTDFELYVRELRVRYYWKDESDKRRAYVDAALVAEQALAVPAPDWAEVHGVAGIPCPTCTGALGQKHRALVHGNLSEAEAKDCILAFLEAQLQAGACLIMHSMKLGTNLVANLAAKDVQGDSSKETPKQQTQPTYTHVQQAEPGSQTRSAG